MRACQQCGKEIPGRVHYCSCGWVDQEQLKRNKKRERSDATSAVVVLLALGGMFFWATRNKPPVEKQLPIPDRQTTSTPAPSPPPAVPASLKAEINPQWVYRKVEDEMGRGSIETAEIRSINTFEFDFPYRGEQWAGLQLRKHPKFGKDVMLGIQKGQFKCNSWDGCTAQVRFDEGKPQTFNLIGPSDGRTTSVFFQNYARFVAGVKKAKQVRIEVEFWREGNRVLNFETAGLEWKP